jgi:phosphate transport system permease protein
VTSATSEARDLPVSAAAKPPSGTGAALFGSGRPRWGERLVEWLLFFAALISVVVTIGIVVILLWESSTFFRSVPTWEFLTGRVWAPTFEPPRFGILPLLCGTLVTTGVALLVALPIGSIVAVYMSEYAPFAVREFLKPTLELLSAIPTVVYGYFALVFVGPTLQKLFTDMPGANMLSAGVVMGLMIIPYVSSLSEDAMRSVPMLLREGAYALGANKMITAFKVVYPAALSGIGSAYILGISRAIGETMIVAIAAGGQPNFTFDPRQPGLTITAYIVQVSMGDLPRGSVGYQSIFAAGLLLFIFTLGFNIVGYLLRKRFRESY